MKLIHKLIIVIFLSILYLNFMSFVYCEEIVDNLVDAPYDLITIKKALIKFLLENTEIKENLQKSYSPAISIEILKEEFIVAFVNSEKVTELLLNINLTSIQRIEILYGLLYDYIENHQITLQKDDFPEIYKCIRNTILILAIQDNVLKVYFLVKASSLVYNYSYIAYIAASVVIKYWYSI